MAKKATTPAPVGELKKVPNHPLHQRLAYWRMKKAQLENQEISWTKAASDEIHGELGRLYQEGFILALAAMKKAVFEPEADEILARAIQELEGGHPLYPPEPRPDSSPEAGPATEAIANKEVLSNAGAAKKAG